MKKNSPAGNRTRVFRVTGGDTYHYTTEELTTAACPFFQVIMLTGDNPLTACHVAKELKISKRKLLVLTSTDEGVWLWQSSGGGTTAAMKTRPAELGNSFDLCLTGDVSTAGTLVIL